MKQHISNSPQQTKNLAHKIAKKFETGEIIALSGDLGSGKTQFTKGLAEYYKIKNPITSPTFVVMKIYNIKNNKIINKLVHVDAYRLENSDEALAIGLEEYLTNKNCLVVIEWAEKIKDILPKKTIWVKFNYGEKENQRIIKTKKNLK